MANHLKKVLQLYKLYLPRNDAFDSFLKGKEVNKSSKEKEADKSLKDSEGAYYPTMEDVRKLRMAKFLMQQYFGLLDDVTYEVSIEYLDELAKKFENLLK